MSSELPFREVDVKVTTRGVATDDPFYKDENLKAAEQRSLEYWANHLDEDGRMAMVVLLRDTFGHLLAEPEAWLPGSLIPESNSVVQIVLTIKAGDLHDEVVLMRKKAAEFLDHQRTQVAELREELRSE